MLACFFLIDLTICNITLYFVESRRCTGDGGRIGA